MSYYSDLIDHFVLDLTHTVPRLYDAVVHRYAPQDASALVSDGGVHLAVWPVGEGLSESNQVFTIGAIDLQMEFQVLYWESAPGEAERGVADETAAADMLELVDEVRARFLDNTNRAAQGSYDTRWVGAQLGTGGTQDAGLVRWFVATVRANVPISYTT